MTKQHLAFLLCSLLAFGCGDDSSNTSKPVIGPTVRNSGEALQTFGYLNNRIGWQLPLPLNWQVVSPSIRDTIDADSIFWIVDTASSGKEITEKTDILALQADPNNFMIASLEPYDAARDGEFEFAVARIGVTLEEVYAANDVAFDHTAERTAIGGLEFLTHRFVLGEQPGKNRTVVISYYRQFGPNMLAILVNYTEQPKRAAMLNALKNATFAGPLAL